MIGALTIVGQTAITKAEEIPIAGIDLVLDNFFQNSESDTIDIKKYLSSDVFNEYEDISFAKVTNYVNIRNSANEEGQILGKLYNNSAATIMEKSGDWYKVKSGSVTGYIKADYLITGAEAEKLSQDIGTRIAVVITTTLKIREKASTDSSVLTLVPIGDELIVEEESDGWIKVEWEGNKTGYVSAEYVELKSEYEEAVSIEEEQERLEAEQAALQEEQVRLASEQKAVNAEQERLTATKANRQVQNLNTVVDSNKTSSDKASKNDKLNETNAGTSSIRNKIVEYALQFVGNPYVWGGTSLTQGADCSGFTQSVFRDNGISIPRTSRTQAISGSRISVDNLQPGDLIFYDRNGTINHVGIYIGNGKVISASSPETGIRITNYNYRQPYRVVSYITE